MTLSTRQALYKAVPTLHYNPFDWLIYCLFYFSWMNFHIYPLTLLNSSKYLPLTCMLTVPVTQNISTDFALSSNQYCSDYRFSTKVFFPLFKEEMFMLSNCFLRGYRPKEEKNQDFSHPSVPATQLVKADLIFVLHDVTNIHFLKCN